MAKLIKRIVKDDFPGMAAEMAYNLILAIFPFMISLIAIFGLWASDNQIQMITTSINTVLPEYIVMLIENMLKGVVASSSGSLLTIGFIITVWVAANAVVVIMKGVNKAYGIKETRPMLQARFLAIFMMFLMVIVVSIAVNFVIFGTVIMHFIEKLFFIPPSIHLTVLLIRWPISFMALFSMAYLVYYLAPNIKRRNKKYMKSIYPGTLFFCLFWLITSWAFSLYVENYGRYNEVYGAIGAVIIILIWLYITSLILLIGGEINSQCYKEILKTDVKIRSEKEKNSLNNIDL